LKQEGESFQSTTGLTAGMMYALMEKPAVQTQDPLFDLNKIERALIH